MNLLKSFKRFLLVMALLATGMPLFCLPSLHRGPKGTDAPITGDGVRAVAADSATDSVATITQSELTLQAITALRDISKSHSEQLLMLDERVTNFEESFKRDLDLEQRARRRDEIIAGVVISVPIIIAMSWITYNVVSGTQ